MGDGKSDGCFLCLEGVGASKGGTGDVLGACGDDSCHHIHASVVFIVLVVSP